MFSFWCLAFLSWVTSVLDYHMRLSWHHCTMSRSVTWVDTKSGWLELTPPRNEPISDLSDTISWWADLSWHHLLKSRSMTWVDTTSRWADQRLELTPHRDEPISDLSWHHLRWADQRHQLTSSHSTWLFQNQDRMNNHPLSLYINNMHCGRRYDSVWTNE